MCRSDLWDSEGLLFFYLINTRPSPKAYIDSISTDGLVTIGFTNDMLVIDLELMKKNGYLNQSKQKLRLFLEFTQNQRL